jgi:hypothetical protein
MELTQILSGLVGACFGSLGWLFVGLYIQRRNNRFAARNAGRAVYFELESNRVAIELARDYNRLMPLSRSAYEQLLPQLAILLTAANLSKVAGAYMAHIGYEQLRQSADVPEDARRAALEGMFGAQAAALDRLRAVAFTAAERSQLSPAVTA